MKLHEVIAGLGQYEELCFSRFERDHKVQIVATDGLTHVARDALDRDANAIQNGQDDYYAKIAHNALMKLREYKECLPLTDSTTSSPDAKELPPWLPSSPSATDSSSAST